MKSWENHQELKEKSPFKDLKWRCVGPEFSGGRIEAIASHPVEPYTLYVGARSGNLWKSVNNGITWKQLTTGLPTGKFVGRFGLFLCGMEIDKADLHFSNAWPTELRNHATVRFHL